ncbi:GAF and ANTAR domain-containing protein [uncultured Citricoccus sp.]|uniref:GAF and ANTAR domain-containing protein n=2 Tax=Citricoccus TaxID=169133 RepID=UPI00262A26CA|nr:GAF and ANTAR domain-containing protein [uncultured Citricoccus sp.]
MMTEQSAATHPAGEDDSGHALRARGQVLATEHFEGFLQALVNAAADVLGPDVFVGVTVVREGHPATVASSEDDTYRFDEIQYRYDEGPCLTALRTNQVVLVDNLTTEHRFDTYREGAVSLGALSTLSLPLHGGDSAVGALNLYSNQPYAFGQRELLEGKRFAAEASRALELAVRLLRRPDLLEHGPPAPTRHTVIDQATGVLMSRHACGPEQAFQVLRESSRQRGVPVRERAEEIIAAAAADPGLPPPG